MSSIYFLSSQKPREKFRNDFVDWYHFSEKVQCYTVLGSPVLT